ncbi:MAG: hypothetical protein QNI90_13420 [Dinoroseobacter sp.]|nr:hypothetical protein [Dinoroseobacter sp.]
MFLIPLIYGGTALAWLIAAVFSWVLVLPRWTRVCIAMFLLSCCVHAVIWYSEPETTFSYAAIVVIVVLAIGALFVMPLALGYRFFSLIFGLEKPKH